MAAAAVVEQHIELQLAGSGALWSIEAFESTIRRAREAFAPERADPLSDLYTRLAREYQSHRLVRTRSGGLPGELTRL